MCGINGVYQYNSKETLDKVHQMNKVTQLRGPDNSSVYSDNEVILGHNRLSIIDLSESANQPFISNDKTVVITYNGELYNYIEIKKKLSGFYDFKTNSDTEVIIAAYKKWGIKMLDHFNGMFAFALWDKTKNNFFLIRDRMGIKPLYYVEHENSVVFSSSVRAINTYLEEEIKVDKYELIDFLSYGTVHSPNSILKEVKLIPKGSYFFSGFEESSIVEYWNTFVNVNYSLSYSDAINETKKLITASVEKRLISDVPYGVFLSGGVDSSILVAAASKVSEIPVNTFSIVFDEKKFDESQYSRLISKKYKTNHNEITLSPDDLLNNIEAPFSEMDHPTIDGINTFFISKAVSEQGYKMAISGAGADELFAGYPVFKKAYELDNKKWLYSFPPQMRNLFGSILKWYDPSVKGEKKADILNQRVLELPYYYPLFRRISSQKSIDKLLKLKSYSFKPYPLLWGINVLEAKQRDLKLPFLSKISILEMENYLQNVLLRDADQMGMANSLEIRVPFLDHKLVNFILSLKDDYKYPHYQKKLLIDATRGWLPDKIINREKMGFVFPWEKWIKGELHDFCFDAIQSLERHQIFNMKNINLLWQDFIKGKSSAHWVNIWTLVVLGKWTSINNISIIDE